MSDEGFDEYKNKVLQWLPPKFREWAPGKTFPVKILILYKRGVYYSIATEYDLVTKGTTAEEANRYLHKLVDSYLRAFFDSGQLYEKSLRPSPKIIQLRFKIQKYMVQRGKYPSHLKEELSRQETNLWALYKNG